MKIVYIHPEPASLTMGSPSTVTLNSTDVFACCSRYQECSDSKQCLIADHPHAQGCQYRKSLEQGHIFYGKNASNFSVARYQDFIAKVSSLQADVRQEFFKILAYFLRNKRGISYVIWAYSSQLQVLAELGLVYLNECRQYVLSKYKANAIESFVTGTPKEQAWQTYKDEQFKAAKARNERFILKDTFIAWLYQEAPELLLSIDEKYRFISLADDGRYADEYIHDHDVIRTFSDDIQIPTQTDPVFIKSK